MQQVVSGKSAVQAYLAAGYKGEANRVATQSSASQLQSNPKVRAEIDRRLAKVAHKAEISAESILRRLDKLADRCIELDDSSGANRALELLGKNKRLFVDKVEVSGVDKPIEQMTPDERRAELARIKALRAGRDLRP